MATRRSLMAPIRRALQTRISRPISTAAINAGQPTPETHPELLEAGEIMPGISAAEFHQRRKSLMSILPRNSLVAIGSAPIKTMSDIIPYPYRPDSDYLYYTGCQQPGGIAVIKANGDLCMFVSDPDPERSVWDGTLADKEAALSVFHANETYTIAEIPKYFGEMVKYASGVYCNENILSPTFRKVSKIQEAFEQNKLRSLSPHSSQIRVVKSPAEISLMKRVADISSQAFIQTIKTSKHWPHEHLLAATIEYESKIRGAQRMAFPPVVGSGANASVIHYSRNDQRIREGDLVLMDAGCELHGYVSDITRTWPPCGSFSPAQREIYEIVLSTMNECFKLCHPGANLLQIHSHSMQLLSKALIGLGIKGQGHSPPDVGKFNPTAIGHYLGMDVHDSGGVSRGESLRPGMVLAIEPGLYFPKDADVPDRYRGIGIRIEDEVLITDSGYEVLSTSIPKTIEELELCIQQGPSPAHPLSNCRDKEGLIT
ncbi:intermediate cleaving peptidase 55, mitochondrial [Selaginella moellendorffii]|uniref:intermediate cleaving peptidase 55, mitochondrial n=1 Tax=Selaginella moellendorffii TaxID=88036 RepID=UPI000D1C370E|nr:intermediate cleaving peptidase 55, mitochondrial [Selaginella moellendorffii]|eukprot:XP_024529008.1 intermediate cleaving peptidase 55, mitochondrial [Selaginella moellendorffii]